MMRRSWVRCGQRREKLVLRPRAWKTLEDRRNGHLRDVRASTLQVHTPMTV